ncbi:MAG: hypothetical protein LQ340_001467 [Diploschistes diacapsis]|nr:MAG: hypothetical protein LQ340_001467 [Diploschistes diacapsis]
MGLFLPGSPITQFIYGPVTNLSMATGISSWPKINEFDDKNGEWANQIMKAQNMPYPLSCPRTLHLVTISSVPKWRPCMCQRKSTERNSISAAPSCALHYCLDADIYISNFYNGFGISTFTGPRGRVATCGDVPAQSCGAIGPSGSSSATTTKNSMAPTTTAKAKPSGCQDDAGRDDDGGCWVGSGDGAKIRTVRWTGMDGGAVCVAGWACTAVNAYYSR